MNARRTGALVALLALSILPAAGCSDSGSAGGLDSIQGATIYISKTGVSQEVSGATAADGTGSGFFIDATGLAVTNYHVVAGASTLEAYIGGDTARTYPVSVVGTSQCNDLALVQVQLTGDEEVPYLEWRDAEPEVGLAIYAAGYPLSDTEFTLTSGIVSKAQADGDMPWASIDYTIEMDANIQPGNSGGPVVDKNGRVVGVSYATADYYSTGTNQFFAIAAPLAEAVIDKLRGGDFESFGVWGSPFQADDGTYLGLWVNAVERGSTAWEAGVEPGDIISTLNSVPVGSDGTLAAYCDVIRTAGENPIAVQIVRSGTGEVLEGNLGSGVPLVVTSTGEPGGGDDGGGDEGGGESAASYDQYISIIDDTGLIYVDVPAEWTDTATEMVDATGQGETPALHVSTNLAGFFRDYDIPGIQVLALQHHDDIAGRAGGDTAVLSACELDSVEPIVFTTGGNGREYSGEVASYVNCQGTDSQAMILWANPTDGQYHTLYVAVVLASARDGEALTVVFDTLSVSDAG